MPDGSISVLIATSGHWLGDARLNRHVDYLSSKGFETSLKATRSEGRGRLGAALKALRLIAAEDVDVVIVPDPELFFLGSVVARITGKKPVIDIHEDYPKATASRPWIPNLLRPLLRALAAVAVTLGRLAAWRVMVAAPELARPGDAVVANIPNPDAMPLVSAPATRRLVYVGDVTDARGALDMVRVLTVLGDAFDLLIIGRIDEKTGEEMSEIAKQASVEGRLTLAGRMSHGEAWAMAEGALAGLNLLHDLPAYRQALATKLWEYMAQGIPPVVTNLIGQATLVAQIDPDLVCESPEEVAEMVRELDQNGDRRDEIIMSGRRLVERAWAEQRPDLALQAVVAP